MNLKNKIAAVFCALALVALCACGSDASKTEEVEVSLPPLAEAELEIPYEDGAVRLYDLSAYEREEDYEHRLWVSVRLDLTGLSERDRHYWEKEASVELHVNGGQNNVSSGRAVKLGDAVGEDLQVFLFSYPDSLDGAKETFAQTDLELSVNGHTVEAKIDKFAEEDDFQAIATFVGLQGL